MLINFGIQLLLEIEFKASSMNKCLKQYPLYLIWMFVNLKIHMKRKIYNNDEST